MLDETLASEIDCALSGFGNATALEAALDAAPLLVPATGATTLFAVDGPAGSRWVTGFTSRDELARFAAVRPDLGPATVAKTIPGNLLRRAVAELPAVGIAIDVAGPRPMLFPPAVAEQAS